MLRLPKSIYFIAAGEAAERFAFYGLSALMPLWLLAGGMDADTAVVVISLFKGVAYISPLVGSVLADTVLGRYSTVVVGMSVYVAGMAVVTLSTLQNGLGLFAARLLLVGLGTGAIKSVVAALVGDQVTQEHVAPAFSVFYASLQIGAIVAFVVAPLLRTQIPAPYNWTIAFGVPAVFMVVALVLFVGAKRWYVLLPSSGSHLLRFLLLLWRATRRRVGALLCGGRRAEWARYRGADLVGLADDFSAQDVADARAVLRVIGTFALFPLYFAVSEQQGSRWIFQMLEMDRRVPFFPSLLFAPDATGIYNPIMTLAFVPVVAAMPLSMPRKMVLGFLTLSLSFVMAAVLEAFVAAFPLQVSFLWQLPQYVLVSLSEVLLAATALQFAYAEAPESMKSMCQAVLLLTSVRAICCWLFCPCCRV
jgi:POT family proton-dependent oligopeptide transporter